MDGLPAAANSATAPAPARQITRSALLQTRGHIVDKRRHLAFHAAFGQIFAREPRTRPIRFDG
jgi:hypothetical protein